jgi:ornithine cyclodeaminase/alanine dehydrogenase-like protein (mu-crystallin family)
VDLVDLNEYIDTVEDAFRMYADGKGVGIGMLHADITAGIEFHIKSGGITLTKPYFALKVNGSSFQNREKYNLPNIMGAIILFDGDMIFPLAVLDSIEITIRRTGAATAVAAKYLARKDSETACIVGYGTQGRIQLTCLSRVLPLKQALVTGRNNEAGGAYADTMSKELGMSVTFLPDIDEAVSRSDVVVTSTPARSPLFDPSAPRPGTFIAAVGADSPDKQELDPALLGRGVVICDITDQCARVGELHHAVDAGVMTVDQVRGELGDVIAGKIPGRTDDDEIIIFDSTGTAIQDASAAAIVYEKALASGYGLTVNLMS